MKDSPATVDDDGDMRKARAEMLNEIAAEAQITQSWLGKKAFDPRVMEAMGRVPRHAFVPVAGRAFAYHNRPLPIGYGQTISQPYIVAFMTDLANIKPGDRVLEVGTGCGYQAAVLAELAGQVYTIEAAPELAVRAAERLQHLGYKNIETQVGDGSLGWPEHAPFQAIVVTAAAQHRVPPALIEQLAPGGRLVIPVRRGGLGDLGLFAEQELCLITKDQNGGVSERSVLPVAFVPLIESGDVHD